jgi:lipoprotein NlpI
MRYILGFALCAVTLLVYGSLLQHDFVNFDDPLYVTENPRILDGLNGDNVFWAFRPGTLVAGNWHPVTLLSHMLDCELFGARPAGHHLSSLVIHLLNVLLLYWLLLKMTGSLACSGLVAAFFAVHPLNVESVAWVAERKNVLSTFFWLATMLAWVRYARRPAARTYAAVMFLLVLGLMSKPMLVTLPFVLLLIDVWPLRRLPRAPAIARPSPPKAKSSRPASSLPAKPGTKTAIQLWLEKLPLFAIVIAFIAITLLVQGHEHAVRSFEDLPLGLRLKNAVWSYAAYIQKMFWPHGLAAYYPLYGNEIPIWRTLAAGLGIALASTIFVARRRKSPHLAVGWFWYLGTLVPVIGIVQVGGQAMADRYAYIPLIGLFVSVTWTIHALFSRSRWPTAGMALVATMTLAPLTVAARAQVRYWQNTETLFRHALRVADRNYFAHNNLGTDYYHRGMLAKAREQFAQAVACEPRFSLAQMNLGTVLLHQGDLEGAVQHLSAALDVDLEMADAHSNLGTALLRMGDFDGGILHLRKALDIDPDLQEARNNLESALEIMSKKSGANSDD